MTEPLLEFKNVNITYQTPSGDLTAVTNASFEINEGEYFGIVGESGCGKSTIVKAALGGLEDNGQISDGQIIYKGQEIHSMSERELNKKIRWNEISYIPQGSMNSLDPLQKLSDQALEIARTHTDLSKTNALERFEEMFDVVGLPTARINDYPHQFSGGMQQRAIIALALFLKPSLLIADEPTTALDVIMQDQIFKHLNKIREGSDTSMMLITHDISLVFESCEKIAVMHAGQVAETGFTTDIFDSPRHPYTILLQNAFPDIRYPDRNLEVIQGYPPQSYGEVDYCTFVDRCPWAIEECGFHAPELEEIDEMSDHHQAACFRKDEVYRLKEENTSSSGISTEQEWQYD
jgi:oligopeptide/dipeptide ABC transporter ATP-binding protein